MNGSDKRSLEKLLEECARIRGDLSKLLSRPQIPSEEEKVRIDRVVDEKFREIERRAEDLLKEKKEKSERSLKVQIIRPPLEAREERARTPKKRPPPRLQKKIIKGVDIYPCLTVEKLRSFDYVHKGKKRSNVGYFHVVQDPDSLTALDDSFETRNAARFTLEKVSNVTIPPDPDQLSDKYTSFEESNEKDICSSTRCEESSEESSSENEPTLSSALKVLLEKNSSTSQPKSENNKVIPSSKSKNEKSQEISTLPDKSEEISISQPKTEKSQDISSFQSKSQKSIDNSNPQFRSQQIKDILTPQFNIQESKNISTSRAKSEEYKDILTSQSKSEECKDIFTSPSESEESKDAFTSRSISEKSKEVSTSQFKNEKTKDMHTSEPKTEKTKDMPTSQPKTEKTKNMLTSQSINEKSKDISTSQSKSDKIKDISTTSKTKSESMKDFSQSKGKDRKDIAKFKSKNEENKDIFEKIKSKAEEEDEELDELLLNGDKALIERLPLDAKMKIIRRNLKLYGDSREERPYKNAEESYRISEESASSDSLCEILRFACAEKSEDSSTQNREEEVLSTIMERTEDISSSTRALNSVQRYSFEEPTLTGLHIPSSNSLSQLLSSTYKSALEKKTLSKAGLLSLTAGVSEGQYILREKSEGELSTSAEGSISEGTLDLTILNSDDEESEGEFK